MKFTGYYLLKEKDLMRNSSVKEIIRIIDAKDSERTYAQEKYVSKIDFINLEARNQFSGKSMTLSITKCTYRFNHYGVRDEIINKNQQAVNVHNVVRLKYRIILLDVEK